MFRVKIDPKCPERSIFLLDEGKRKIVGEITLDNPHVKDEFQLTPERPGSPIFYRLLDRLANLHEKKSHDYASTVNPVGNYHFAGLLASMFSHSPQDAGFIGRIGEKIYRLSNLEKDGKTPKNESIEDTELDICVITLLWMSDRQERRAKTMNAIDEGRSAFYDNIHRRDDSKSVAKTDIATPEKDKNPLQDQLLDLIKLMPDFQVDELLEFVFTLRRARNQAKSYGQQK